MLINKNFISILASIDPLINAYHDFAKQFEVNKYSPLYYQTYLELKEDQLSGKVKWGFGERTIAFLTSDAPDYLKILFRFALFYKNINQEKISLIATVNYLMFMEEIEALISLSNLFQSNEICCLMFQLYYQQGKIEPIGRPPLYSLQFERNYEHSRLIIYPSSLGSNIIQYYLSDFHFLLAENM